MDRTPSGTSDAILRQGTPRSCGDVKPNGLTSSGIYSNIGAKCLNQWNQFSAILVKQTKNKQVIRVKVKHLTKIKNYRT